MIKNVVFDLGRVLVDFYPLSYLDKFEFDDDTKNKLNEIIFESKDWSEYDRGIYLHNTDIAKKLVNEHPEFEKEINFVLQDDWVKMHYLRNDVVEYLKNLKMQGINIYILSNLSKDSYDYISKYDFFKYVDGGVFSYEIKACKPNEIIYKTLLERYNLIPEETAFFDDKLENVETAIKLGIQGIQFLTLEDAKVKLKLD